jgi:hypothetical protein
VQTQYALHLTEGRFGRAVATFGREGGITWADGGEAARAALVAAWMWDTAAHPAAEFAVGDRVQITETDRRLGLHNGNAGTITGIDGATGTAMRRLDGEREVPWRADEFAGFGTAMRGRSARARQDARPHLPASHAAAGDGAGLRRPGDGRLGSAAGVSDGPGGDMGGVGDLATADELAPALYGSAGRGRRGRPGGVHARSGDDQAGRSTRMPPWLIPLRISPETRGCGGSARR